MKPYIGILIDSFWEAASNRVLWVLLIGWSLILLGLAPFGYVTQRSFQLSSSDIGNRTQLIEKLAKGSKGQGGSSILAVVELMDTEFLKRMLSATDDEAENKRRVRSSEIAKQLNVVLKSKDLYSEEAFPGAKRRKRLEPLVETPSSELSQSDLEELNRELLQLAFPTELQRPRGEQLWFGYAGFRIGTEPLPFGKRQANKIVEPLLQGFIVSFGLGFVVVFVALIVTSSIIPDTFRSSSLHLLLSKPISRIWLFISKFFGSCFFVLINLALVIFGLYLIAGFRLDIWNEGLFLCIPILMFVFVIFYSVSAFVGLVWGNAIVCFVTCILFWLGCFTIGFLYQQTRVFAEVFPQIRKIVPADEDLVVVNGMGNLSVWNSTYSVWQPAIEAERFGQARTFGPVYSADHKKLIFWSFFENPFNLGSPSRAIQLVNVGPRESEPTSETVAPNALTPEPEPTRQDGMPSQEELATNNQAVEEPTDGTTEDVESSKDEPSDMAEAREAARWSFDKGPSIPAQIFALEQIDHEMIAVCRGGLYSFDLKKLELIEQSEKALFGWKLPFATSAFVQISPKDFFLSENLFATVVQGEAGLVTYSSGNLDWLVLQDGKFSVTASTKLEGDGTESAIVGANANFAVVVRDELPLMIFNRELVVQHQNIDLPRKAKVKQLAAIPNTNRMAIVSQSGDLWQLDCETGKLDSVQQPFGRNCTAMHWLDSERVWLGIAPNRTVLFNLATSKLEEDYSPSKTTFEWIFSWLIRPVYTVLPKPSSLGQTMQYILSGEETVGLNNRADAAQLELDIWEPIYSNLAFVAFMLTISCIFVTRKEF